MKHWLWSSFNISDQFKNNTLEYREKNKDEWVHAVVSNGLYDEEALNYFLTRYFSSSPDRCLISIPTNLATIKFVIILKENYKFLFNSDICFILGFENEAKLSIKYDDGIKVLNITRNGDIIHIHCSLVDSSIVNGNSTSSIIQCFKQFVVTNCSKERHG